MLKKEITLGSLLSILGTVFALGVGLYVSIQVRMSLGDEKDRQHEEQIHQNELNIIKVDDKREEDFRVIIEKLEKIYENTKTNHNGE